MYNTFRRILVVIIALTLLVTMVIGGGWLYSIVTGLDVSGYEGNQQLAFILTGVFGLMVIYCCYRVVCFIEYVWKLTGGVINERS